MSNKPMVIKDSSKVISSVWLSIFGSQYILNTEGGLKGLLKLSREDYCGTDKLPNDQSKGYVCWQ